MVRVRLTGAVEAEKLMKLLLKDVVNPDGEMAADMATVRLKPLRLLTTI
jgi:hypothetical protein